MYQYCERDIKLRNTELFRNELVSIVQIEVPSAFRAQRVQYHSKEESILSIICLFYLLYIFVYNCREGDAFLYVSMCVCIYELSHLK